MCDTQVENHCSYESRTTSHFYKQSLDKKTFCMRHFFENSEAIFDSTPIVFTKKNLYQSIICVTNFLHCCQVLDLYPSSDFKNYLFVTVAGNCGNWAFPEMPSHFRK